MFAIQNQPPFSKNFTILFNPQLSPLRHGRSTPQKQIPRGFLWNSTDFFHRKLSADPPQPPLFRAHWFPPERHRFPQLFPGIGLSRPDFLHNFTPVVKSTACEKVGNPAKAVEAFYVNRKCISTPIPTCGKLLWRTLWRMWKTASYQQVFRLFPNPASPVEKSAYPFAYPFRRLQKSRVTSPLSPGLFLSKAFEKVYKL